MRKILLSLLAALSFGTASAKEQADGTWKWEGVAAPEMTSGASLECYIRNVQTGEFLATASFTTVVDNAVDNIAYKNCNAGVFTIAYANDGWGDQYGFTIKNSNNRFVTWGGQNVPPLINLDLDVNSRSIKKIGIGNAAKFAYLLFSEGTPSTGYMIYFPSDFGKNWYLYLKDDHKTLTKSSQENETSPYINWQFISKDEMKEYHEYVQKNNVLNLYNTTLGSDIKNNHEYTKVHVHRALKAGYSTIALPFNVADVEAAFGEGAYVSKFTGATYENGVYTLNFTKQKNIVANEPYILHLDAATPGVITFENTTVVSEVSVSSANSNGWTFHSNFLPNQSMENKYGVVNSTAKVMRGTAKSTINGLTAYFTFDGTASSAQAMFLDEKGELTDIQQLEAVGTENGKTIFNLAGQRINNAANGINIINGRKVIKK